MFKVGIYEKEITPLLGCSIRGYFNLRQVSNVKDKTYEIVKWEIKQEESTLFESTLANVIAIDTEGETIHFYSSEKGSQKNIHHEAQSYRARPFDDEFFEKLGHIFNFTTVFLNI